MTSNLPIEIWNSILKQVPKSQISTCINVCSLFRGLALPILFSSIRIYLIGSNSGLSMLNTTDAEWMEETALKLMGRSWALLNRICRDPIFAKGVRSLTIVAFMDGLAIFEKFNISATLQAVSNLETFRWIGCAPLFDHVVANSLPPNLRSLVIQSYRSIPWDSIQGLSSLTCLHLPISFYFPDDEEVHDGLNEDQDIAEFCPIPNIGALYDSPIFHNLTDLRIPALHVRDLPIRLSNALLNLEIFFTLNHDDELIGLDLVLHHVIILESLSLVGYLQPQLLVLLSASSNQNILPALTSLRISSHLGMWEETPSMSTAPYLTHFLENRNQLRRLYIRLPGIQTEDRQDLLSVIKALTSIEVLGVYTGLLQDDSLGYLLECLPTNLIALQIAMDWRGYNLLSLIDALETLPKLTFLHLYGTLTRLPILLEDMANACQTLTTVGLNRSLWTIDRQGSNILTTKWPRWRIKFNTEEEFDLPDHAWLFKYY
ncbi:hypothetical protein BJ165DRAFT_1344136 [Panaeolus papilionaceus]|nr:hypothetical protein BJ165DRAFT_1344136 [Panaeolus papilionaceus]